MSQDTQGPTHKAIGKKWAAILAGVAAVATALVPPIVSMLGQAPGVSATGNGVAAGGNVTMTTNTSTTNVFNRFASAWIDGAGTIAGTNAASSQAATNPSLPQPKIASTPPLDTSKATDLITSQPTGAGNGPPVEAVDSANFPIYEDAFLRAKGLRSSLGSGGLNTVIPVRIENKGDAAVLLGHDSEVVTVISDTGETNNHPSGCGLSGIRSFQLGNLQRPLDQLNYTRIMPRGNITLQIRCALATADSKKINSLNVNVPLVRVENEQVVRFTINLDGIPVSK
jgi:hypothetical protein